MQKSYTLTSKNIDIISQEIFEFLQQKKQTKEDIIRTRLSVETVLLYWLEHGYADKAITVDYSRRFRCSAVRLIMEGELCDPTSFSDQDNAMEFVATLQGNLGLSVSYEYKHGCNIYDVKLPMPAMGSAGKMALAFISSLITCQLLQFAPPNVGAGICANIIEPTLSMLLGLIAAVATFLIFFNVCSAICGMGNLAVLTKFGGRLVRRSQLVDILGLLLGIGVGVWLFDVLDFSGEVSLGLFGSVYQMFLKVVPNNILAPFVSGNTLQVLFLAICSGMIFLILGRQIGDLVKIVRQINLFLMTIMNYFCYLVPFIIYLSFTGILLKGQGSLVLSTWKIIAACYITCGALIFIITYWCILENDFSMKKHFARILPVTFLAFTTASTAACIPLMSKMLADEGVKDNYKNFALPLCQTLASPGAQATFILMILGVLGIYHQAISLSELVVTAISVYLVVQTLPPVAGGDISLMTLLLLQVGVPKEAIATYIAMSLFIDMCSTSLNKTTVMNVVFNCAKQDGMITEK